MADEGLASYLPSLDSIQRLPSVGKVVISTLIVVVAVYLIYQIWQAPSDKSGTKDEIKQSLDRSNLWNSINQNIRSNSGFIFNNVAPVTEKDRVDALEKLRLELTELALNPRRGALTNFPTLLQNLAVDKLPQKLFVLLNTHYYVTIKEIQPNGRELLEYRQRYDLFEVNEQKFEEMMMTKIGSVAKPSFDDREIRGMYLRYIFYRAAGQTDDQIKKREGDFLGPLVAWPDANKVFEEITAETGVRDDIINHINAVSSFREATDELLRPFALSQSDKPN